MRHEAAPAEQKMWACLRNRQLNDMKFRRQHRIGPFIADFYCAEHRLIIECDGDSHAEAEQVARDDQRTRWLTASGHHVIRYLNTDVHENLDGILEDILIEIGRVTNSRGSPSP